MSRTVRRAFSVEEGLAPYAVDDIAYPQCQRGTMDTNYAHEFESFVATDESQPLIYCRACGQIRKLEITE